MTAQSIAYHAHGTADGGKSCCYPWLVCHDIKSVMHCSLRLAPTMINHLTSTYTPNTCCAMTSGLLLGNLMASLVARLWPGHIKPTELRKFLVSNLAVKSFSFATELLSIISNFPKSA